MSISEHYPEIKILFEILERSKEEPWMMCVPLPRVLQLMSQTISLSLEDQAISYPELFFADSFNFSGIPKEIFPLLRDSKSLNNINPSRKEDMGTNKIMALTFNENISLFEKLHLNIFKELGQEYSNNLFQTENKSKEFAQDFLRHKCTKSSDKDKKDMNSYLYFFTTIASNKDLFLLSLAIQNSFLKHCSFSIISVKVIKHFLKEVVKHSNHWSELFPVEFIELLSLIDNPPCIKCNCLLSTQEDLQALTDQVHYCLRAINNDDELRIIFCLHSEWLVHCNSHKRVKSLFVNFIKL